MNDAAKIKAIDQWPRYPWLPMKRPPLHGEDLEVAVLWVDSNDRVAPTLYKVNLYAIIGGALIPGSDWPRHTYTTMEALLADGWIVD